jgi:hypothetical protein
MDNLMGIEGQLFLGFLMLYHKRITFGVIHDAPCDAHVT